MTSEIRLTVISAPTVRPVASKGVTPLCFTCNLRGVPCIELSDAPHRGLCNIECDASLGRHYRLRSAQTNEC